MTYTGREERTVGVGDALTARSGDFTIVTFALGSCAGLTLWDPLARVGGLLHSQLPVSYQHKERAEANPYLFTDTGVTTLLREVFSLGGDKRRLVAKLVGCAERAEHSSTFRVGQRNLAVARRVLWKNDIVVMCEDVGGDIPRTLVLDMESGDTTVRARGLETII